MGIEQSRRDDIESIGYVMMYLLRGILPWQNMKAKDTKTKYKLIMEKKISTPADFLTKGFPNELATFINYAKGLKFQEKPDYKYLKTLLSTARKANKIEMDGVYDWSIKTTTNTLNIELPYNTTYQKPKPKEEKVEPFKAKKQEAIDEALNDFKLTGGALLKSGQISQNGTRKQAKEVVKSLNKSGQISAKNQNTILGSVGLQTLVANKISMPKISVVRK